MEAFLAHNSLNLPHNVDSDLEFEIQKFSFLYNAQDNKLPSLLPLLL